MTGYTPHQRRIISGYYENRENLMVQKLAEIVSQLYVAENDKERQRLWRSAEAALRKLELPRAKVEEILERRDVAALAKAVEGVF